MAQARKVVPAGRSIGIARVVSADGRREVGGGLGADGEAGMKASYYLLSDWHDLYTDTDHHQKAR